MKSYLSLVKFSHTIFALPFALVGLVLGFNMRPSFEDYGLLLFLVMVCMVTLRSAAMAFNRYLDSDIDALNERTKTREIPSGVIGRKQALLFVLFNVVLFLTACYFINTLCFLLAPIAILITLGYSYTKRFTFLCHFVLGLGLALAPVGAYLAVTSSFSLIPVLYGFVVLFWVAGFDIIYALQDASFDSKHGLHSIPQRLGVNKALWLSRTLHLLVICLLFFATYLCFLQFGSTLGILYLIGTALFVVLLMFQHTLVSAEDLSKVNLAFFTTNGVASVCFGMLFIIDFYF